MKIIFFFLIIFCPLKGFAWVPKPIPYFSLKYLEGEYVIAKDPIIHYVNGEQMLFVVIKKKGAQDLLGAIIHDAELVKKDTIEKVQKFVVTIDLIFEPGSKKQFIEIVIQGFLDKKLVYETHEFYERNDRSFIFTPPKPLPPPSPKKEEEKKKESKIPRKHPSNSDGITVLV